MFKDDLAVFSNDYFEARAKFREAAARAGAMLTQYSNPQRGPMGRELTTDVAHWGAADAQKILMLICGSHGVEGLPGSACFLDWLQRSTFRHLPADVAAILVHGINPFGMAWRQRQTEDNIDLNRNFVDFEHRDYPSGAIYDEVHDTLVGAAPETPAWRDADHFLANVKLKYGRDRLYTEIMGGQHRHPDGLFFSGAGPTWSQSTIRRILTEHCLSARSMGIVDFHTGLGPYGYGMLGCADNAGSGGLQRAREWFGAQTVVRIRRLIDDQDSATLSKAPMGDMGGGIQQAVPNATVTYVALEVGTYEVGRFLDAYRANCWMQKHGSRESVIGERIAGDFESVFYPRFDDWKEMLLARARQVTRQALFGLGRAHSNPGGAKE